MFEKIKAKIQESALVKYAFIGFGLFGLFTVGRSVLAAFGVI